MAVDRMREAFEACYARVPTITPTKETAWFCYSAASKEREELLEAARLARNILFLLQDEVKALGHDAENVREKLYAAIAKATGSPAC